MKEKEFLKQRKSLQKKLAVFKKGINKEYAKITKEFIKEVCPLKENSVYELLENGVKRRGFARFVIYTFSINFTFDAPMIRVGGWWLDKNNIPTKWDTMTVYGVGNPAIFKLSDNQKNEKTS